MPRTYVLRIFLNDGQPDVIAEASGAMAHLVPRRVGIGRNGRVRIVRMHWGGWPTLLPQHGKGRKHTRRIALEPWQETLVASRLDQFLRGLIQSDGCRHRRIVRARTIRHTHSPIGRRTSSSSSPGRVGSSVSGPSGRARSRSQLLAALT